MCKIHLRQFHISELRMHMWPIDSLIPIKNRDVHFNPFTNKRIHKVKDQVNQAFNELSNMRYKTIIKY